MSKTTATRPDTIEGILKVTGATMPDYTNLPEATRKKHEADFIWEQIVKALNKIANPNWVCDLSDHDQYKYWPWPVIVKDTTKPTGFAFSSADYNYANASTIVGSRLCFENSDDVMFALEKFEQQYIASVIY